MQTFLPHASFTKTAKVLDYKRLGNQRLEAMILINGLSPEYAHLKGWRHHPVSRMWAGYTDALKYYFNVISLEWEQRGYAHNIGYYSVKPHRILLPPWLGSQKLHCSHRAALLHKLPEHYSQFGWKKEPVMQYYWPVRGKQI